jgi:hypothetical protein
MVKVEDDFYCAELRNQLQCFLSNSVSLFAIF